MIINLCYLKKYKYNKNQRYHMKFKDLEEMLIYVKEECIKERIDMLTVYKVLHIIKTFFKK